MPQPSVQAVTARLQDPRACADRWRRHLWDSVRCDSALPGLARQEPSDRLGEFFTRVLLQEVSGVRDDRMLDVLRTTHLICEDRRHRTGDRITVAEGDEHRSCTG